MLSFTQARPIVQQIDLEFMSRFIFEKFLLGDAMIDGNFIDSFGTNQPLNYLKEDFKILLIYYTKDAEPVSLYKIKELFKKMHLDDIVELTKVLTQRYYRCEPGTQHGVSSPQLISIREKIIGLLRAAREATGTSWLWDRSFMIANSSEASNAQQPPDTLEQLIIQCKNKRRYHR